MGTGYACPVCDAFQADAAHLANHLAFTAMLGDDDHEAWLDERVSDWADRSPETLGPAVAEHAPERDRTPSTGGAAGDAHGHGDEHGHEHQHDHARGSTGDGLETELARQGGYGRDAGAAGGDVDRVLAEARDLTERMAGTEPLGADGDEAGGENEREDGSATDAEGGADGDATDGSDASESEAETE